MHLQNMRLLRKHAKQKRVSFSRLKKNFQDLFLKFKPIWIQHIVIVLLFCVCVLESTNKV